MINKKAEIKDRILLYNACKGILRTKLAGLRKFAGEDYKPHYDNYQWNAAEPQTGFWAGQPVPGYGYFAPEDSKGNIGSSPYLPHAGNNNYTVDPQGRILDGQWNWTWDGREDEIPNDTVLRAGKGRMQPAHRSYHFDPRVGGGIHGLVYDEPPKPDEFVRDHYGPDWMDAVKSQDAIERIPGLNQELYDNRYKEHNARVPRRGY